MNDNPYYLKYLECISDPFPAASPAKGFTMPTVGHLYSVRNVSRTEQGEEEFKLWEIFAPDAPAFPGRCFRVVENLVPFARKQLDAVTRKEVCTRYIFSVDKMRRMGGGVASELLNYQGSTIYLKISSWRSYLLQNGEMQVHHYNIADSWRRNPELRFADKYQVELFYRDQLVGVKTDLFHEKKRELII